MSTLICIVARNNLALTQKTVRSAANQTVPCDILVVDNASTDSTAAWLQTKPVARISYQEQKSLAACWNAALRAAWGAGYGSVLMLNNDVEVRPDAADLLTAHGGDFVTCVSVDTANRMGTAGDRTIEDLRKTERPHPDFSCWLMRKAVTDRNIWFDEEMHPAYCEDSDFHVKMHRAGIRAVCLDIPFLHHGASTLKAADKADTLAIQRGADKNRQRFKAKYGCLPGTPEYEAMFVMRGDVR